MGKDRVKPYFEELLKGYVFDELSESFLEKMKASDIFKEIPVPIKAVDFTAFCKGEKGITVLDITRATAVVIGAAAADFPYSEAYKKFLDRIFEGNSEEVIINEGRQIFEKGEDLAAAAYFRAALRINPESLHGLYSYALCCRELYLNSEDENFIGKFKAESIEAFETLSNIHPDFAFTYYYLGYAYLNMGLYTKAFLAWNDFLEKVKDDPLAEEANDEIKEIKERLASLEGPMEIEAGVLAVSAGRYNEGIETLSKYTTGPLSEWWPMYYYLGVAYESIGKAEEAIEVFKKALVLSPSNIEVMDELVSIYRATGDTENEMKYLKKIEVVNRNLADERAE